MSGFEVVRRAFGRVAKHHLDVDVDRLVVQALIAAAPGPCRALTIAGQDAALDRRQRLDRASACFLFFATANLSDDLSDGDCAYLPSAAAQVAVLMLDWMWLDALRELILPPPTESRVLQDLLHAEQAQAHEVMTERWDADRLLLVTDGIAGDQWSAYLRIMWAGTRLEHLSADVGRHVGRAALLAGDIATSDRRYTTLTLKDRRLVLEEALTSVEALRRVGLPFAGAVVAQSEAVLMGEMTRTLAGGHGPVRRAPEDAPRE